MNDLISRSALEKDLRQYADRKHSNGQTELANGILKGISRVKAAPAVDAVEVVRCGECIYNNLEVSLPGFVYCNLYHYAKDYDGFCDEAERRTDGT